MPIEQVVFDIDHTFGPFLRVQLKKFQAFETLGAEHLRLQPEQVRNMLKELNNIEGIDNSFILQGIPAFREFYFDQIHEKQMWELIVYCKNISEHYTRPYEGVLETISTLKHNDIKIAVWSDAPWFKGVGRLIKMGLPDCFTVICAQPTNFNYHELYTPPLLKKYVDEEVAQIKNYGGGDGKNDIVNMISHHKPHLEGLEKVVAVTGIPPERMMMVGDSVEKDYRAQEAAGMCAVLANVGIPTEDDYELLKRYVDPAVNKSKSTEGQSEEGVKKIVKTMPEILYYLLEQNKKLIVKSKDRMVIRPILSKIGKDETIGLSLHVNVDKRLVEFFIEIVQKEIPDGKEMKNVKSVPLLLDSLTKEPTYFYKKEDKIFYYK